MSMIVSLLRAINLGAKNKIRMPELAELYGQLGLEGVKTYLQSGNVVFNSSDDPASLSQRIETAIERKFGFPISVLNISATAFKKLVEENPFAHNRTDDPTLLYAVFLFQQPDEGALQKLDPPRDPGEEFAIGHQVVYLYCPNGFGRSKLAQALNERKLGVTATTRNWRTVLALDELASAARPD